MSVNVGRQGYIGVGLEATATPGTATTPDKYIPFLSNSIRGHHEPLFDEQAKGQRDKTWGSVGGKQWGEGDLECILDVENSPYIWIPALGTLSSTTAAGEAAVYEHTITRKTGNNPQTATLINNRVADTERFAYGTCSTLDLSVSDGLATISSHWMSQFPDSSTIVNTQTEERIFSFKDYSIQFGTNLTTAALATATPISSLALSINNNSEMQFMSGDASPASISHASFEVNGNFAVFFEDEVYKDQYYDLTKRAAIITFTGDAIGVAEFEEIKINLPVITLEDNPVETGIDGFYAENPTFRAEYGSTDSYTAQVIITNETATYL